MELPLCELHPVIGQLNSTAQPAAAFMRLLLKAALHRDHSTPAQTRNRHEAGSGRAAQCRLA
jgi:hypothetical protein